MRALLLMPLVLACGGSAAEKRPASEPRPRVRYADCAGPKEWKCGGSTGTPEPIVRRTAKPEPPPRQKVPDAVEAGPAVYRVVLENEEVRVLVADYAPGAKVPMHRHPDHVVFALTGGKRILDGTEADVAGGAALFERAGKHEVDAAGPTATRAILVELGARPGSPPPAGDDPVASQPRRFKLLLAEKRVRVLDVTHGKGTGRPVALGDHVLLARDRGTLVVTPRGASAQTLELEPGEVVFLPAGVYTATNPKRESFEVILFELRP